MPKNTKSEFKYQRRTKESVKERANMKGGNFDQIILPKYKVYKPHDGKNLVRILPPTWDDAQHYGYDLWINYGIGVDNQSYLSLSKMKNEKDPLAEARREAEREGDKDTSKALMPRQRIAMWVVDRLNEDEGPQFWLCPFSVDKDILSLSMDEDTKEVIFIDDPEKGNDLRFYKEGEGLTTKYPAAKIRILKPSPISEDEGLQKEWLEYIEENPVPDCLQFYDYDHIAMVFDGQVRTASSDDDDEKPKKVSSLKSNKEEDDSEDEKPTKRSHKIDTDNDEEEQPKRRSKITKPKDEDDDEEEESPKQARRRVAEETDDEEEDDEPKKPSLRERLRQRHRESEDEE